MSDEIREFHELENPAEIDFTNTEKWAWGFGHNKSEGFIYHYPDGSDSEDCGYCVAYKVPPFMIEMITNIRDGALYDLKRDLRTIENQKAKLLEI